MKQNQEIELAAREAHKDLQQFLANFYSLDRFHYWGCLGSTVILAVHTIQGTGDSGAETLFCKTFNAPIPDRRDDPSNVVKLSEFRDRLIKEKDWGTKWKALFESSKVSGDQDNRVLGKSGDYSEDDVEFLEYYGLKKQWLGRVNKDKKLCKIEGACRVIDHLLSNNVETHSDLVNSDCLEDLKVFGLSDGFKAQLRKTSGDPEAIKVDLRLKRCVSHYVKNQTNRPPSNEEVRHFIRSMAKLAEVDAAVMDHTVYKWMGINRDQSHQERNNCNR